jgi:hypothetical protein
MALERVPADIRKDGGVARMSDPDMIQKIKKAVTIPVMAKVRTRKQARGKAPHSAWLPGCQHCAPLRGSTESWL